MTNVFCVIQCRPINEGTVDYWTVRVFHAERLFEFESLKLEGLADLCFPDYEDVNPEPALEWYTKYQRYISDKPIYQGDAPSPEMVTEILKQKYHLNVIKYIY